MILKCLLSCWKDQSVMLRHRCILNVQIDYSRFFNLRQFIFGLILIAVKSSECSRIFFIKVNVQLSRNTIYIYIYRYISIHSHLGYSVFLFCVSTFSLFRFLARCPFSPPEKTPLTTPFKAVFLPSCLTRQTPP